MPVIWPPLLGIVWAVIPVAALFLRSADFRTLVLYLWSWSIIVPALALGVGALVVRYRYGSDLASGRWRRSLWYWVGGLYVVAAIPVLVLLL